MSTLEPDRLRVAELDVQILDLKRSMSALLAEQEVVQHRLDSFTYPVLSLPNEIVAEIFVHCTSDRSVSPIFLTQICRRWRDIVLATPTLWRAISLLFTFRGAAAHEVHKLETWLSRSGCCPMSVQISVFGHRSEFQFSSTHCARWEVLQICGPLSQLPIAEASMPMLRHLDLTRSANPLVSYPVVFGEMPLLRSVILNYVTAETVTLPWVQLTVLELHHIFLFECTPILQQTPNLIHCKLGLMQGNNIPSHSTTLLCLKSLVLLDYGGRMSGILGYIEAFFVPALRELEIPERFLPDPIPSLTSFMSKSGCQLGKVTISGPRLVSSNVYHTAFPSVEFSFTGKHNQG